MEVLTTVGRMALVFALLAAVLWVLKRSDALRGRPRVAGMQVTSSTRLGKTATLNVVEVDGRRLVLAVTPQSVTVLTELAAADGADAGTADGPSFAALLAAQPGTQLPPAEPARRAPPTPAAFLRDVWTSVRRRPLETADLSPAAIAAALSLAGGASAAPSDELDEPLHAPPADGSAATRQDASRRPASRTDAPRLEEERQWSRAQPTAVPSSVRDAAVV